MPPSVAGQALELELRRWMSRGVVSQRTPEIEMLNRVLSAIDTPGPDVGLAALRYLGQTGQCSSGWIAAADPVHYQARLRDVRLRSLPIDEIFESDIQAIFSSLNERLNVASDASFACFGGHGYLHASVPMQLPSVSAQIADGHVPDKFTASGNEAKAYHQLLGEIQLFMHEHPVNIRRQQEGMPVINSLWLWGGGVAPETKRIAMPDLYTTDTLFVGYWAAAKAQARPWLDFANCLELSPHGFVAVLDENSVAGSQAHLVGLDELLKRGKIQQLIVLFRDGLEVVMNRFDHLKIWRGMSSHLVEKDRS